MLIDLIKNWHFSKITLVCTGPRGNQGKPDWYFGLRLESYACAESTGPWCLLVLTVCVLFSFVFPCAFGLKVGC